MPPTAGWLASGIICGFLLTLLLSARAVIRGRGGLAQSFGMRKLLVQLRSYIRNYQCLRSDRNRRPRYLAHGPLGAGFAGVGRCRGHRLLGRGSVRPPGYAKNFAAEHNIPEAVTELADLIPLVDVVLVQSCNWDLYVERVRPFVEAGRPPVAIASPCAGVN